jgi:prevent-host-death family protein
VNVSKTEEGNMRMKQRTLTATEFRAKFFALLEDAMQGQTFVITKDGHPVAQLVPYKPQVSPQKRQRILRNFRKAFSRIE